jgi:hypothetical protein
MRTFIVYALAALALASPAAASQAPLVVAMSDPGCHWFSVGGKYTKSVVRSGPVTLLNRDEAALKVRGPGGTKIERVGVKLTLRAKGTYRITMVGQAPDDNTLTLKVK